MRFFRKIKNWKQGKKKEFRKRERDREETNIEASVSNFSHFHGTFHLTLNKRELRWTRGYKSRQSLSSKVWRNAHGNVPRIRVPVERAGWTKRRNANKCDSVCRRRSSLSNWVDKVEVAETTSCRDDFLVYARNETIRYITQAWWLAVQCPENLRRQRWRVECPFYWDYIEMSIEIHWI